MACVASFFKLLLQENDPKMTKSAKNSQNILCHNDLFRWYYSNYTDLRLASHVYMKKKTKISNNTNTLCDSLPVSGNQFHSLRSLHYYFGVLLVQFVIGLASVCNTKIHRYISIKVFFRDCKTQKKTKVTYNINTMCDSLPVSGYQFHSLRSLHYYLVVLLTQFLLVWLAFVIQ